MDRRVCTSTHDVVPEERHSEPEGQHEQVGLQSRKLPRETGGLGTEIPKAACYQDTWVVDTKTRQTGNVFDTLGVKIIVCPLCACVRYHAGEIQRRSSSLDPDRPFSRAGDKNQ